MARSTTTIQDATDALKTVLDGVTGADPDSPSARIRYVFWGQGAPTERQAPFLAMQPLSFKKIGNIDGANEWDARLKLRVIFNTTNRDTAKTDAVNYMTQIADLIDGWLPADGIEGGEEMLWAVTLPNDSSQGSQGFIESELYLKIYTTRGAN